MHLKSDLRISHLRDKILQVSNDELILVEMPTVNAAS